MMLLIHCPYCGPRAENEFRSGGEAHLVRPALPDDVSDADWASYLYFRANPKGQLSERWHHVFGCQRWFTMVRNTQTHEILGSFTLGGMQQAQKDRRQL